jgi:hypothetical protein
MQFRSFIFTLLTLLFAQANAFHFYLGGSNNEKCFYQDLQQGSVLAGKSLIDLICGSL